MSDKNFPEASKSSKFVCMKSSLQIMDYLYLFVEIQSYLEIDFEINISDKKSRRFDLSEVIFKCIKVL